MPSILVSLSQTCEIPVGLFISLNCQKQSGNSTKYVVSIKQKSQQTNLEFSMSQGPMGNSTVDVQKNTTLHGRAIEPGGP